MKQKILTLVSLALLGLQAFCQTTGTVTDVSGNTYGTVKIGSQWWIAENLKADKLNDGTPIPYVSNGSEWANLSTPGYCWINDSVKYRDIYGALYNWYVVSTGKVCPIGWHVPSNSDWDQLLSYLGGQNVVDYKMKEAGTAHWQAPNKGVTNESGFTALPGGLRMTYNGIYSYKSIRGYWWSSNTSGNKADYERLTANMRLLIRFSREKQTGFSIRCVEDIPVTGVSLSPTSLSLAIGDTSALTATILPSNATDKSVSWSSSDTSVVTVSSSGEITAVAAGSATITVTTQDGNKTSACQVTVTTTCKAPKGLRVLRLYEDSVIVRWNVTTTAPEYSILLTDGSSITTIVSTSTTKTITGLTPGTEYRCKVRSKCGDTWSDYSPEINFTTAYCGEAPKDLRVIDLYEDSVVVKWNVTTTATEYSILLSIGNIINGVYSTSTTKTITGLTPGTEYRCKVRSKCGDTWSDYSPEISFTTLDNSQSCEAPKDLRVTDLYEDSAVVRWDVTANAQFYYILLYTSTTSKGIFSDSTTKTIKGLTPGTEYRCKVCSFCEKTLSDYSPEIIFTTPESTYPVTGVSLSPTSLSLAIGDTSALTATILPSNATDKSVSWSSSDTSVVTVSSSGEITAVAAGSATIIVTTQDGGKTATCVVQVSSSAYCASKGNNSNFMYIKGVTIGSFSNTSGASDYTDFTGKSVSLAPGTSYNITLEPGYEGSSFLVIWRIWIDFNQNNSFDDAEELVFTSEGGTTATGTITIPASVTTGTTRMRVSMKYSSYGVPTSCETFYFGEVEDYTVNITNINLKATELATSTVSEESEATLRIFPNPVVNNLRIGYTGNEPIKVITIIDTQGRSVVKYSNPQDLDLDVSNLSSGLYILLVNTEKDKFEKKFIKQ